LNAGRRVGTEAVDFARKDHQNKNQDDLQKKRDAEAAVGINADGGFSSETSAGTGEGRADVGGELLPSR
jgi:hypothetical protein